MELFAKSYEYVNGKCYVDGVLQTNSDACSTVGGFVAGAILVFFLGLALIGLLFFAWWVWMLVHIIKNEDLKDRTIWLITMLVSLPLGLFWIMAPVYHIAVKRPYDRGEAREVTKPPTSAATPKK